ncbi:hypothetical protein CWATWH8502_3735 [Crocosphaera watsonii WH 8502]|uniref:Uncharacterized protein n=5 Tax=Crocosphaera watsonii TaxID=263511 RepID=T2JHW1_CROWT|nr:hypothetical protein CWATWH0003_4432 [Crocosphaera watsonii WH 0003]CCQ52271.1 hypothetical protein CWATWH8502_3735 [Crocosphaera watsonii WH 8502]CCQ55875.1 hypothetical protein CWATWH0005_3299 [Crocosphaera watsonii WH 0005]CCQ62805.1 hypothetical protein CWATWH0401_144 [Crocosphaera watsonii WH 0401]CCQ64716.1 hypothetical protein CWATWH0402_5333 [Crocosphaera watsonii WH 0402]
MRCRSSASCLQYYFYFIFNHCSHTYSFLPTEREFGECTSTSLSNGGVVGELGGL